jgi:hypothetical protein
MGIRYFHGWPTKSVIIFFSFFLSSIYQSPALNSETVETPSGPFPQHFETLEGSEKCTRGGEGYEIGIQR